MLPHAKNEQSLLETLELEYPNIVRLRGGRETKYWSEIPHLRKKEKKTTKDFFSRVESIRKK